MWLIKAPISTARVLKGKISLGEKKTKTKEKVLCLVLINLIFTSSLEKQS